MDPLTLGIGAAFSGGSILANMFGSSAAERARQKIIDEENQKQAALMAQAQAANQHSLGLYNNFAEGATDRGKGLGDYLSDAAAPTASAPSPTNTVNMPASTSLPTQNESAIAESKGAAEAGQQATSLGQVRGFGDYLGDVSRQQARDAETLSQIGSFQRGNAAVEGLQLDEANQAGSGWNTLGSILGGVGKIGLNAGLNPTLTGTNSLPAMYGRSILGIPDHGMSFG